MGDDDLTTAERALSDAALAGDTSAQALVAEVERLRAIEAAARALSEALRHGCSTAQWYHAQFALREALAKGGAK